jgi:hypothetical protein
MRGEIPRHVTQLVVTYKETDMWGDFSARTSPLTRVRLTERMLPGGVSFAASTYQSSR